MEKNVEIVFLKLFELINLSKKLVQTQGVPYASGFFN